MLTISSAVQKHLSSLTDRYPAGKYLDVGSTGSSYPQRLIQENKDISFLGIDTRPAVQKIYQQAKSDFLNINLPPSFDVILMISFLEFVGTGSYDNPKGTPNDWLKALIQAARIINPGGSMLFTLPIGMEAVFAHDAGPVRTFSVEQVMGLKNFGRTTKSIFLSATPTGWKQERHLGLLNGMSYMHNYPSGLGIFEVRFDEPQEYVLEDFAPPTERVIHLDEAVSSPSFSIEDSPSIKALLEETSDK